jgi:hypothetical protein
MIILPAKVYIFTIENMPIRRIYMTRNSEKLLLTCYGQDQHLLQDEYMYDIYIYIHIYVYIHIYCIYQYVAIYIYIGVYIRCL